MIVGAAGVPQALGETRDYDQIFSQLEAAGVQVYFPTTQYAQIPEAVSLGYETDFLPPPYGTANASVYEAMRAHGIKLAINAEHLYDFSQPLPPLSADPLAALIAAAGRDLIYAVYAPDEPAFRDVPVSQSQLLYERVKAVDPTLPVMQVQRALDEENSEHQTPEGRAAYLQDVLDHAAWADIVGFDVYPVGVSIGAVTPYSSGQLVNPAQAVAEYMAWLAENLPDKEHVMVLQGFNPTDLYTPEALAALDPETVAAARAPTAQEMRDMLAAAGDASAVFWWGQSHLDDTSSQTWQNLVNETYNWVAAHGDATVTVMVGTDGDDSLVGGDVVERIAGGLGNDTLQGNAGNDVLVGGAGQDAMYGGLGNDVFAVDNAADVVTEAGGAGTDEVRTSLVSFSLAAADHVENLTGTSSAGQSLTGNDLANVIVGSWGSDTLSGAAGLDTLRGGGSNDVYVVDSTGDVVDEAGGTGADEVRTALASYSLANVNVAGQVENLTGTSSTGQSLSGNSLDNVIVGGVAKDTLDGAGGADTLRGGAGDDVYIIDAVDTVDESAGAGVDEIRTTAAYFSLADAHVLGAIENLTGLASTAQFLVGSAAANSITSAAGDDAIDGGAGADSMRGGAGDDYYYVDASGDAVIEAQNSGTDLVESQASFVLGSDVEYLLLVGSGNLNGSGNDLANWITGNAGNNVLNGKGGNDALAGGDGNDTYIVDSVGDMVLETSASGTQLDTVCSIVSFGLAANIENLILQGSAAITGLGNELANRMWGNSAANTMLGGLGNDSIWGGAGLDILYGETGNDMLHGGADADRLIGGLGDDRYVIDNVGDIADELAGNGIDVVVSSVSFSLADTVHAKGALERLNLTGTAVQGVGNSLNNSIIGNDVGNILTGAAGNDVLTGGAGDDKLNGSDGIDTLNGGSGKDFFIFTTPLNAKTNRDVVADFNHVDDTFQLENAIFTKLGAGGALNPSFFFAGTAAKDANDYIVYNKTTGALFYDSNGNVAGGAVQFATLSNRPTLQADDFVVI